MRSLTNYSLSLLIGATTLLSSPAFATPAQDAEIRALKEQLAALSERLEALETSKAQAPANTTAAPLPAGSVRNTANSISNPAPQVAAGQEPVVGGSTLGSFKVPGTNTSFKFGGYAKMDASYSSNGYDSPFIAFANIPIEGSNTDQQNGAFAGSARQSRINLSSSTPTAYGDVKTFWEIDFYGNLPNANPNTTNGDGVRIRHAYGEVGPVLAGFTWSNFMDMDSYPESLDLVGPAGVILSRQAQVRYTDSINDKVTYAVALEVPNTEFSSAGTLGTEMDLTQTPDLIGRVKYKDSFGHLSFSAMARRMNASYSNSSAESSEFGWGLGTNGKLLVGDKDSFSFGLFGGEGLGRYIFDVGVSGNGNSFVNGDLEAQMVYSGYADYRHYWSDNWRSNLLLGYVGIDNEGPLSGAAVNSEIMSGHVNLIWSPVPQYRVGMEYMHGYREMDNGQEGDIDRVMMSFMYLL